jgi:hypothetical protein
VVERHGLLLPKLIKESVVYFHQCIWDLLRLSINLQQVVYKNLLVVAIILYINKQMDLPLRENKDNQEVFLQILDVFLAP